MKNRINIICLLILVVLAGCGRDKVDGVKPNDELSENICNNTDGLFTFLGSEKNYENALVYSYYIDGEINEENIALIINSASSISAKYDEKVCINVETWIPGGIGGLCSISNYYQMADGTYYVYPDLCVYTVLWQDLTTSDAREPSAFTGAEGIKYFRVDDRMNEKAKEQEINWYEIWPDLEGVEVLSH